MKGKFVSINNIAGTSAVTVVFTGDRKAIANLTSMDAVDDRILLFSDGLYWKTVSSIIA